jgi:hypothetical protein
MTNRSLVNYTPYPPRRLTRALSLLAGLALLAGFSLSARPALAVQTVQAPVNYYVNNNGDTDSGYSACQENSPHSTVLCTLRAAIEQANAHTGPTIVNIYVPAFTIALTSHNPLTPGCLTGCTIFDFTASKNIIHLFGVGYGREPQRTVIDGLWRNGNPSSCYTPDIINFGSTSIDGVRLIGGCNENEDYGHVGGAVVNIGTLSISSSVITDNFAVLGGGGVFNGVVVFADLSAGIKPQQQLPVLNTVGMLNITGTEIRNNLTFGWGGGILSQTLCERSCLEIVCVDEVILCTYTPPSTSMTLSNDFIHDNVAGIDGGGVYNAGGAQINDDSIYRNQSFSECARSAVQTNVICSGGGIYNAAGSTLELAGSKVFNNISDADGGGVANAAAGTPIGVNPVTGKPTDITIPGAQLSVDRSLIQGNTAITTGGGIENDGRLWIYQTKILGNTVGSNNFGGSGGGIFSSDHLMITASTIDSNKALGPGNPTGGGITAIDQTWLTTTTITNNSATSLFYGGSYGGGVEYDTTTDFLDFPKQENLQLQGVTIKGNHATYGGGLSFDAPLTNSLVQSPPPLANVPAQARLNDTLITLNTASNTGGGIYNQYVNDIILSGTGGNFGNSAPSCPNLRMPCS